MNRLLLHYIIPLLLLAIIAGIFMVSTTFQPLEKPDEPKPDTPINKPANFWSYYRQAEQAKRRNQFREAARFYGQALSVDPNHQGTLYELGNIHLLLRNFKQAEASWQQLLRIDSTSVKAHKQLGSLYVCAAGDNHLYNLTKAQTHYRKALDLNRIETHSLFQLAKIRLIQDETGTALILLDKVIRQDFRNYQALFLKGFAHWKRNEGDAARNALFRADSLEVQSHSLTMHGEGATKDGFKPMLQKQRFCDTIGPYIDSVLSQQPATTIKTEAAVLYQAFEPQWQCRFQPDCLK